MKYNGVMASFYNLYSGIYNILRGFIRLLVFIAPMHRVRDEETGEFLGIVFMRPYISEDGTVMVPWLWIGDFEVREEDDRTY